MAIASDNVFPKVILSEGAAPAAPAAGQVKLYAKADGLLYSKDDAGVESAMGPGAAILATIADAKGDLIVATAADTVARLAVGTNGYRLKADSAEATGVKWVAEYYDIPFFFDGGGSALTTGRKLPVRVDIAGVIESATLLLDQSGSIVVDIWKDTYANYPPTVADTITASAKPTVTTATKSEDTTLTGWTTTITAGDILIPNIDSITTATWAVLILKVRKT